MYFTAELTAYLGSFNTWGFLIAFLYNLSRNTGWPKLHKPVLSYSAIMLISYFLGDLVPINERVISPYLVWGLCDIATLIALFAVGRCYRFGDRCTLFYLFAGLVLNLLLTVGIHIDLYVLANIQPWWYWSVYSIGVSSVDVMLVLALIIQRDFLGIYRLTLGRNKVQ